MSHVQENAVPWQYESKLQLLGLHVLGGAYIPPAKLKMLPQQITDKSRYNISHCMYFASCINIL